MHRFRKALLFAILCIFIQTLPGATDGQNQAPGQGPRPAVSAMDKDGGLRPGPSDRCPLCGMFPAKWPESAAGMRLVDGRTFYFCCNGCLLQAWRRPRTHLGIEIDQIAAMTVLNTFTGKPTDASKAVFVAGSDLVGPMGQEIAAFSNREEATAFRNRHGGRLVFELSHLDDALWVEVFGNTK